MKAALLRTTRWLTAVGLLMVLAACQRGPQFEGTDITGAKYAKDFALTDFNGKPRTLADFRGKVVVMFFGYTQCPDVCPTAMLLLSHVMKQLGPADAARVQVLFVTLDPQRDTPLLLSKYVPAFDPHFLGLYGTAQQTEQVAADYKIFYRRVEGATPNSYTLDHSGGMYVYDPQGHLRLYWRPGMSQEALVHDTKLLLDPQ